MIRDTTTEDNDELLRMCKSFFSRTGYARLVDFDKDSMIKTLEHLRNDDNGVLLIATDGDKTIGMIGALLYPFYFNHSHTTGQEMFWWVDPEHRKSGAGIELLKAVEAEARQRGAQSFSMIALDSMTPEQVGNIYMKQGYQKSEHSYIRSL